MVFAVAPGNVLVVTLPWRLGLAHFVARVQRAAGRAFCLPLLASFAMALTRPFGQGPQADAQTQQTNTCQLPDARLHGVPLGRKYGNHRQSTVTATQAN
jgi:hypothetical protein